MSVAHGADTAVDELPESGVLDLVDIPEARPAPPPAAPPPPATPAPVPSSDAGNSWLLPLVVLIVGMFMSVLDTSIVNVAIPVIQKEFGVSADSAQWISTSYSLTEGVMVPLSAWLGIRVGPKNLYIWSMIAFTAASALCGLSDNLGFMIAFRILQGIPGGMIPVTCITMLYKMVPPAKLGSAMGLYGLGVVVAPAAGPTLGGFFSEYVSWRLVYYVNLPVGVLGAIAAATVLVPVAGRKDRKFDLIGFLCIAGGLFALLLAFEEGPDWGWTGYRVLMLFAAAINLFALFVVVEMIRKQPLIDLRIFAKPQFGLSLVLITIISVGFFSEFFFIPQFLQGARGYSPLQAGLALVPQAGVLIIMMPITGRLYDRFGSRWLAVTGFALAGTGLWLLSGLNIDTTEPRLTLGMVTMAAGLGLGMMPTMTGGMATLSMELADSGGAFNTLVQRVSSALGLGILSAMVTVDRTQFFSDRSALVDPNQPAVVALREQGQGGLLGVWQHLTSMVQAQSYANAFLVAAWFTLGGVMLAMFLPSGRPSGAAPVAAH